jgi:alpha-L-fucosidase
MGWKPFLLVSAFAAASYGQTPDADDLIWQKSIQKFNNQRNALLAEVDNEARQGLFQPNWDSLKKYQIPEWYQDAKFGIFIHWGVYSVPAFDSEWYPRNMYLQGSKDHQHQVAAHGPENKFGYKDYIPEFKAENFDPHAWADLFRRAGAKYVVPVAEHHDGFAMYNSDLSDWTAAKMGPKRDVIAELSAAVREEGLHLGLSSHRIEHYFFMNGGRAFDSDVNDPRYAAFYGPAHAGVTNENHKDWFAHPDRAYLNDWLARTTEIVNKYRPEIVWFDWWINTKEVEPYLQRFAAFYYNDAAKHGYTAAINYKYHAYPDGAAVLDIERGQLDAVRPLFWQTDTSVSIKSWGYIEGDTFRTPESLIGELVDVVSKNGSLLLNVGPKPDGTIPEQARQILLNMGRWLSVNGEAIYGTRPWKVYGEGPTKVTGGAFHDAATKPYSSQDIRFTTKGETLYAIALAWPEDGKLTIKSLAKGSANRDLNIRNVQLLGYPGELKWTHEDNGVIIQVPAQKAGDYAYVFKISQGTH